MTVRRQGPERSTPRAPRATASIAAARVSLGAYAPIPTTDSGIGRRAKVGLWEATDVRDGRSCSRPVREQSPLRAEPCCLSSELIPRWWSALPEEDHGGGEADQRDGAEWRGMGADQDSEQAEQDGNGERRARVAAQGDPGRDHRDQDREASDTREDAEIADQGTLREVLNQR
jgi:hypothetical protein